MPYPWESKALVTIALVWGALMVGLVFVSAGVVHS